MVVTLTGSIEQKIAMRHGPEGPFRALARATTLVSFESAVLDVCGRVLVEDELSVATGVHRCLSSDGVAVAVVRDGGCPRRTDSSG